MEGSLEGTLAAILLFGAFQICGVAAAFPLLPQESAGVRLLFGSVAGSLMLQWFPALFAFGFGFSPAAHLLALLLALGCAGASLYGSRAKKFSAFSSLPKAFGAFGRQKFLLLVLLFCGFFVFLVFHSFRFENNRVYCCQSTYGDMSMHLSFITSLARQQVFPPEYSLLPGVRLSYPFLSDSISSSLYLLGAPLRLSYALPMCAAGAQVFFGASLFFRRMLGSPARTATAFLLFFCNGGLGVFYFLGGGKENFTRIFTAFYETPTNYVAENIRWVNVIADMMLPQRATLFGWAILFPTLYLLYRGVFEGEKRFFLYGGVLAGALPMVHTHSFLALAVVCGGWLVLDLCKRLRLLDRAVLLGKGAVVAGVPVMCLLKDLLRTRGLEDSPWLLVFISLVVLLCLVLLGFLLAFAWRQGMLWEIARTWGILALAACLLALPQLFVWTFRQAGAGQFVRGHFGWVTGEDNYLWFYLKNLGLAGVLAFCGLITCQKDRFARYVPALVIWLIAEFVEFQPNDYDNNKLLYVGYALLCCCGAEFFWDMLRKIRQRGARNVLAGGLTAFLILPAFLTLGREAVSEYEIYGDGALSLCAYVEENLPPDAVVLTDTRHNNEICALAGRNVVCGSPSYLFYHGLPYYGREFAVREMYEKPAESLNFYRSTHVSYVLYSDFENSSYQVDAQALDRLFTRVYDDGVRILYKVELEEA